jgi:hypothetical protein
MPMHDTSLSLLYLAVGGMHVHVHVQQHMLIGCLLYFRQTVEQVARGSYVLTLVPHSEKSVALSTILIP